MSFERWNGPYNRVSHSEGEADFPPSRVEPGESLPTRVLVERMVNAGVARSVHNALLRFYEFGVDASVPEDFIGPLGRYSCDIVDVGLMKEYLDARIRENKERMEAATELAAAKKKALAEAAAAAAAAAAAEGE